jgi:hypothetical protein
MSGNIKIYQVKYKIIHNKYSINCIEETNPKNNAIILFESPPSVKTNIDPIIPKRNDIILASGEKHIMYNLIYSY